MSSMQSVPSKGSFEIAVWTLCTLSVCCLASRLVTSRLTTTIELLWLTLYLVKASFLVQSKFYKPLYAYVSPNLTRYYWASVGMCGVGFFFTLIITIVLCPHPEYCRHTALQDTLPWEITLSTLDILTDLLVISIPVSLACLANFTLSNAIINTLFKSLSVFPIIITVCRTIFQINKEKRQINYLILALWLAIEAAVAVIMGSVSSYRTVVLKLYATHIRQQRSDPTQSGEWVP